MSGGTQAPWGVSTVADVARLEMGQSPDGQATNTKGKGIPLIGGAADYKEGRIEASRYTTEPTKVCCKGDLILCIRATIGKVAVADKPYCLGRGVAGLRPSKVTADFLRYFLNSQANAMDEAGTGTTFRQIDKKTLSSWSIPLPEPKEQRRIVAKLDSLFKRSKSAREELTHIPRLVERYKEAILAAAFHGELTVDWRQDHPHKATGKQLFAELVACRARHSTKIAGRGAEALDQPEGLQDLPHGWTWCPVAILASTVSDGVHKKPDYVERGIPFLTVRNLTAGPGITFDECRYVTQSDHEEFIKRTHPERGDLLISKDGTLGVVRAIRTDVVFSIFVSVALVKPVDRSMTDYLELAFTSPQVQQQMGGVGTGLQHIHLTDLRRDFVPIAPAEERAEIVKRVHSAFAYIERLETEPSRAAKLIDRLDQATLAKAFRGELLPQSARTV
jgi:type I restriction enzyme S subunit